MKLQILTIILVSIIGLSACSPENTDNEGKTGSIDNITFTDGDFVSYAIELNDDDFFGMMRVSVSTNVTQYGETGLIKLTWTSTDTSSQNPIIEDEIYLTETANGYFEVLATGNTSSQAFIPKPFAVGSGLTGRFGVGKGNERQTLVVDRIETLVRDGESYSCAVVESSDNQLTYYFTTELFLLEVKDTRFTKVELLRRNHLWQ